MLALAAAAIWTTVLFLPWRPWSTREFLDAAASSAEETLDDITVLIPARDEAKTIQRTLPALEVQGRELRIIVVDDRSTDGTAEIARRAGTEDLFVLAGKPLPPGWSGKLWALEQGRSHIRTPLTLLLDADIELEPGILAELRRAMETKGVHLVSLMATLRMSSFWERLLLPGFIYFFKTLYPFRLSNSDHSRVAAAAGGCILLKTRILNEIGGFGGLRGELIDDCALARRIKGKGYKTWIGLSHSVLSLRGYEDLRTIWDMVARTAFTQLRYSGFMLALCTVFMVASFWLPPVGLLIPSVMAKALSALALGAMMLSYLPTLKFYGISFLWALTMPLIGTLYLAMTWTSAVNHWLGAGSHWKGRDYTKGRIDSDQQKQKV
ncbi:MAG: glycosyltransferase [Deltaproteobacteria bacterium]|nr:MAG: glycosyltransferase [Deltaproteobacteria bacterium]